MKQLQNLNFKEGRVFLPANPSFCGVTLILFLIFSLSVRTGPGDLEVEINPQPVMAGEPCQLILKSPDAFPEITELPEVQGLTWLQGTSKSHQTSIINFKTTTSYAVTYRFIAEKGGNFTIPAMKVQTGRKKVLTDPLSLKALERKFVVEGGDRKKGKEEGAKLEDIFFMRSSALTDRKNIYVGEEIPFEIRIYSISGLSADYLWPEINIENAAFKDFGDINKDNSRFQRPGEAAEQIDGRNFNVMIFKTAFRPIASGTLTGKVTVKSVIKIPDSGRNRRFRDPFRDSFFDDFFSSPFSDYKTIEHTLYAEIPEINVQPLPTPPGNSSFLGLTGNWELKCEISQEKAKRGEPLTLKITAGGEGSTETLKAPEIQLKGFRVYPPEIQKELPSSGRNDKIEIRYVLIPLEEGPSEIDLNFCCFSTLQGNYTKAPFYKKIFVEKSDISSLPVVADAGQDKIPGFAAVHTEKTKKQPDGILYLKKTVSRPVFLPLWRNHILLILALLFFGPAFWGISEFLHYRRIRLTNDPLLRRKLAALSNRGKILREIRKSEPEKIQGLIQNQVVPYLNDILGFSPGTSGDELASRIDDKELAEYLRSCSDSAYMPGASRGNESGVKSKLLKSLKKICAVIITASLSFPYFTANGNDAPSISGEFNPLTAYDNGDFAKSAEFYRGKLNEDAPDPAILYNLGNCLYQSGKLSLSLICYEKASKLSPRDSDIHENLNFVRRKLMLPESGKIERPGDIPVDLRDSLRPDEWFLAASLFWAAMGIILGFRRAFVSRLKLAGLFSLSAFIFILCLIAPLSQYSDSYSSKLGFVVKRNAPVYLLPSENSRQSDFRLTEGDSVMIKEERQEWFRVRSENAEGWVRSDSVSKIWK